MSCETEKVQVTIGEECTSHYVVMSRTLGVLPIFCKRAGRLVVFLRSSDWPSDIFRGNQGTNLDLSTFTNCKELNVFHVYS